MSEGGISIQNTMVGGIALAAVSLHTHVEEEVLHVATEALAFAKEQAPWTDQTGDARRGLDTDVQWEGETIAWYLYHTVDYGIYLETRWNGKYSVIMPTLELFAPEVGKGLKEKTEIDYG